MTEKPELKHERRPRRNILRDLKPWQIALFIGCPAGNLFYFAFILVVPDLRFAVGAWLGVTAAAFFMSFAVAAGAHGMVDFFVFSLVGGSRHGVDRGEAERSWLLDGIAQLDGAGEWRQANQRRVELLDKGLAANPAAVAFDLGRVFEEKLRSPVEALRWYRRCAGYGEADNAHFHEARSRAELLKHAVRADDKDRQARETAVGEAIRAAEYERAQAAIDELARLHPHSTEALFFRGVIAARRGAHALAAGHFREALQANPADERAAYSLAAALTHDGQMDAARQAWREYLEKFPSADPQILQSAREALAELDLRANSRLE